MTSSYCVFMQVQTYYLEDVLALTENQQVDNGKSVRNKPKFITLTEEDKKSMDEALKAAWLNDDFETLMDTIEEFPRLNLCNYKHTQSGATPLMVASAKGRVEDVKHLLSLGADTSVIANNGDDAVRWATKNGQQEVAALLNEHMKKQHSQDDHSKAAETALLQNYQMSVDQVKAIRVYIEGFPPVRSFSFRIFRQVAFWPVTKTRILVLLCSSKSYWIVCFLGF